jgi:hypothetical protein
VGLFSGLRAPADGLTPVAPVALHFIHGRKQANAFRVTLVPNRPGAGARQPKHLVRDQVLVKLSRVCVARPTPKPWF